MSGELREHDAAPLDWRGACPAGLFARDGAHGSRHARIGLWAAASRWAQFVLSTPVVLWAGWPFFVRGWRSLVTAHLNMFTLDRRWASARLLFTAPWRCWRPAFFPMRRGMGGVGIYFEAAAMIIVLVLLGQVLELRARSRTGSAIRALLNLAPATARIVEGATEREVALDEVSKGATLARASRRQSAGGWHRSSKGTPTWMSPCSLASRCPWRNQPGDAVTGGTINGTGSFLMRAERVGSETMLARIVQMVAEAQRSRAPIQALADRVAG